MNIRERTSEINIQTLVGDSYGNIRFDKPIDYDDYDIYFEVETDNINENTRHYRFPSANAMDEVLPYIGVFGNVRITMIESESFKFVRWYDDAEKGNNVKGYLLDQSYTLDGVEYESSLHTNPIFIIL
jgi:hypothetical protein